MTFFTVPLLVAVLQSQEPKGPTQEQAAALVKIIEEGRTKGSWEKFDKVCDLEEFARRMIGKADLSGPMKNLIRTTVQGDDLLGPHNLLRTSFIEQYLPEDLTFLRIRMVDGAPRPLYRSSGSYGPGWYEWILGPGSRTEPRVIDAQMFSLGEPASVYMARSFIPEPEALKFLNKLKVPLPEEIFNTRPERHQLMKHIMNREMKEAFEWFEKHKEKLGKDKMAQIMRLQVSTFMDGTAQADAYDDFEKHFPGDPALRYNRLGALRSTKKFDQALETVDQIDRDLGGDPLLDSTRAGILYEAGRKEEAEKRGKRCTDAEPTLAEGWYTRVTLRLMEKDWSGATDLLRTAEKTAKIKEARIKTLPNFKEYSESDAYLEWTGQHVEK